MLVTEAHARSDLATQVTKDGMGTTLRDQHLADYEARLRQEDLALLNPNAVNRASALRGTGQGRAARPGIVSKEDLLL